MTTYKTLDLDLLAAAGSDSFARERAGMKAAEDAAEADDLDDDPTEAEAICQALDRADPDDVRELCKQLVKMIPDELLSDMLLDGDLNAVINS